MMRQYELVERVLRYDPKADETLLNRAYVYAMRAHGHQKRASGDPYFSHPLEVAAILTDLKLDDATIATALLHDVIEDTEATRAEIDQLFGSEIGVLVDGLTKIKRLDLVSKKAEQAENFRKLLVAISTDIRVLLVKLADRLHNMRTLEHMSPESRRRNSEETLEIYAPLAGRMGMQAMREELEELAFRWLHPEAYRTVRERLDRLTENNKGLVEEIRQSLVEKLAEAGFKAEVTGREKKPYSIWRKMQNRQISLEQLSDLYGFRVICDSVSDCYRALGLVHTTWRAVPGRFKDYISTPKQNGYRSIHTTIVGPRHQRVELQLRTEPMHVTAEYGVAAHTFYKEAGLGNGKAMTPDVAREMGPYIWLRRLVETLLEGDNSEEFLEHTKLELFHDQVFCFTPKGRLIALPQGATPIDFAYAVHTDVGNSCVGASINGRQMPLSTALRNGDEVLILTSASRTPPAAWERIAVTGKARSAIRRAARDSLRRQYAELGRRLISSAFGKIGQDYSDDRLRRALSRLTHKTVDDVHAAVGRSELPIADVIRAIAPEAAALLPMSPRARPRNRYENGEGGAEEGWFNLSKVMGLKFRWPTSSGTGGNSAGQGIVIRGIRNDVPVSFEPGGAVPGDRIVGVLTPGEGIRIFQIHSPRLSEFEHERWIDVTWDINQEAPERFPARLSVTVLNEPGTLAQIAQVIGEADGNIDNLKMLHRGADFTEMMIEVEVFDLAHLNRIINGLKSKTVVSKVERVFA
ncbi:bifunctional (p)ppGpp synthetase/guanosine-3',5'-bis(diphosphate) 3'-pyrophosphohydrolase [Hyphomicrobium sp. CS1BSMeth3]|uniref:RelA/SpoT family protein n=1 Tax=Hyphomicrobium sp. CS1BSMeth3 TaxID=1892844 RepID=UPI0009318BF8|nr:bifunctional (p)ppGpp synthetase/guanosine-3',5'-bis(diphosphate) 3'-pyrophosphohydrolase [Hyphomicrobium sp. CS1BSMeth3]